MTKTEHYSLPQWEAHDALKRSDFNEAMESIDAALGTGYSNDNKPWEVGFFLVNTASDSSTFTDVGTVLKEFDFVPSCVLLHGGGTAVIRQGSSGRIALDYSKIGDTNYDFFFALSGTQLKLSSKDAQATAAAYVTYVALR